MDENCKILLADIFSDRLKANWNHCDNLPMGSKEYNRLTDECSLIHRMIREFGIPVDTDVEARF